jgi:outer membrane protein OmpA-like peptidoglycan-associated protein
MRWIAVLAIACACRSAPPAKPVATKTPAPAPAAEAGKPPEAKVNVITETTIELLDPITFLPGSATFEPTSMKTIDAIAHTLAGNPSLKLISVQAFGSDAVAALRAKLGAARAQAIVDELVARGVERRRLLAEGDAQPPAGYSNEPIFVILERTP